MAIENLLFNENIGLLDLLVEHDISLDEDVGKIFDFNSALIVKGATLEQLEGEIPIELLLCLIMSESYQFVQNFEKSILRNDKVGLKAIALKTGDNILFRLLVLVHYSLINNHQSFPL